MIYISDANEYFIKVKSPLSVILTVNDNNDHVLHMSDVIYEKMSDVLSNSIDSKTYWDISSSVLDSLLNYKNDVRITLHLMDANYNILLLYLFLLCGNEINDSTNIIEFINQVYVNDTDNIIQVSAFKSNDKNLHKVNELLLKQSEQRENYTDIYKLLKQKLFDGKSIEFAIYNMHIHEAYNTINMHYLQVLNDNTRSGEKQYIYIGNNFEEVDKLIYRYIQRDLSFNVSSDHCQMNTFMSFFSTLAAKIYYSIYMSQFGASMMGETFYKFWQLIDTSKVMMVDVSFMLKIQKALSDSRID